MFLPLMCYKLILRVYIQCEHIIYGMMELQVNTRQATEQNEKARLRHKHALARVKLEKVTFTSTHYDSIYMGFLRIRRHW